MSYKTLPDAEYLRQILSYDPDTGALCWRDHDRQSKIGSIATRQSSRGRYQSVKIDGHLYFAHRIIWKMFTGHEPVALIDHRNGDGNDNRIANLRPATRTENNQNARKQSNNKSGFKGVSWHRHAKRWVAQIRVDGRKICLGYFRNAEDAHKAYCIAAARYHGQYAKT